MVGTYVTALWKSFPRRPAWNLHLCFVAYLAPAVHTQKPERSSQNARNYRGNPAGDVAAWNGDRLHGGRLHSHSSGARDHRHFGARDSGPKTHIAVGRVRGPAEYFY